MHCYVTGRRSAIAGITAALVIVFGIPLAYAPQPDKPEKISVDVLVWNPLLQVFRGEHRALSGIATAGERAEFTINTLLLIADADGNQIDVLGPQVNLVISRERATGDGDRFVRLVPQLLPWDRLEESFAGTVMVTVLTDLRNAGGETIATATAVQRVEIR